MKRPPLVFYLCFILYMRIPLILSTRSAPHCPANPLYAVHLSERSDACFYYIKEPVRVILFFQKIAAVLWRVWATPEGCPSMWVTFLRLPTYVTIHNKHACRFFCFYHICVIRRFPIRWHVFTPHPFLSKAFSILSFSWSRPSRSIVSCRNYVLSCQGWRRQAWGSLWPHASAL